MAHVRERLLRSDGGIVSLAAFVTEHDGAIEYDLLTRTGYELRDIGGGLSWHALESFISNLEESSALARELNGEYHVWASTLKTNGILADIYDVLSQINANLVALGKRSASKPVQPYPRPGMEEKREEKIGKGALPKEELKEWIERKRQLHERND